MTYQPLIPLPSDLLSKSQGDIKNNFTAANTVMGVNHYPFDDATSNKGLHKWVTMPNTDIGTVTPKTAGVGNLFARTGGGITQLNYSPDAGGNRYRLTRCDDTKFTTFAQFPGGDGRAWSFLPGGILFTCGYVPVSSSTTRSISFSTLGLPDMTTTTYNIQITAWRTTSSSPGTSFGIYVDGSSVLTTGFDIINQTGHDYGFYWQAIGI